MNELLVKSGKVEIYGNIEVVFAFLAMAAVIALVAFFGNLSLKRDGSKRAVSFIAIICIAAVVCTYTGSVAFADEEKIKISNTQNENDENKSDVNEEEDEEDLSIGLFIDNEISEKGIYNECVTVKIKPVDFKNDYINIKTEKVDDEKNENTETAGEDIISPDQAADLTDEESGLPYSDDDISEEESSLPYSDNDLSEEESSLPYDDDNLSKDESCKLYLNKEPDEDEMSRFKIKAYEYEDFCNELIFDVVSGEKVKYTLELIGEKKEENEDAKSEFEPALDNLDKGDVVNESKNIYSTITFTIDRTDTTKADVTEAPEVTVTLPPSETPGPTLTPKPTETQEPTPTPKPIEIQEPTPTPKPIETPEPSPTVTKEEEKWPVDIIITDKDDEKEEDVIKETDTAVSDKKDENIEYKDTDENKNEDDIKKENVKNEKSEPQKIIIEKDKSGSAYILDGNTKKEIENIFLSEISELTIIEENKEQLLKSQVTITVDGETRALESGTDYEIKETNEDGKWKYEYILSADNFNKDGLYQVNVTSVDKSGNTSNNRTAGTKVDFIVDKTAPTIIVSGLKNGAEYNENKHIVSITIHDNTMLSSFLIYKDKELYKSYKLDGNTWANEKDAKDRLDFEGDTLKIIIEKDKSEHTYSFTAADESGNEAQSTEYTIKVSGDDTYKKVIFALVTLFAVAVAFIILKVTKKNRGS